MKELEDLFSELKADMISNMEGGYK